MAGGKNRPVDSPEVISSQNCDCPQLIDIERRIILVVCSIHDDGSH